MDFFLLRRRSVLVFLLFHTAASSRLDSVVADEGYIQRDYEDEFEPVKREPPQFPGELSQAYADPEYLGSGSSGDGWAVIKNDATRQRLCVKIYKSTKTEVVKEAKHECNIATYARNTNDIGRERIAECFGLFEGPPLHLALQHGGDSLQYYLRRDFDKTLHNEVTLIRIMAHTLQAVRLFSSGRLPRDLVHHDLKPDNLVYDGLSARMIDFGATQYFTSPEPGVSTRGFAPPCWYSCDCKVCRESGIKAWATQQHPHSFDTYSLGKVYEKLAFKVFPHKDSPGKESEAFNFHKSVWERMIVEDPNERPFPDVLLKGAPFIGMQSKREDFIATCYIYTPNSPRVRDWAVKDFYDASKWKQMKPDLTRAIEEYLAVVKYYDGGPERKFKYTIPHYASNESHIATYSVDFDQVSQTNLRELREHEIRFSRPFSCHSQNREVHAELHRWFWGNNQTGSIIWTPFGQQDSQRLTDAWLGNVEWVKVTECDKPRLVYFAAKEMFKGRLTKALRAYEPLVMRGKDPDTPDVRYGRNVQVLPPRFRDGERRPRSS